MVPNQSVMISVALSRRISGTLFLIADIILLASNYATVNYFYLIASCLFISCAIALYLSSYNHRWLFYNAVAVILGYFLVSFFNDGIGTYLQYIGGVIGIIGGLLILRSAFQREYNKQYRVPKIFNFLDKYPLASAGAIEGTSAMFIFVGSILSGNSILMIVSFTWFIAHTFLFLSDEYLRKKLNF